jgi:AcrR family transcriptional regulator
MHLNQKSNKEKWLEEGYRQFAESGPENLSINKLSKSVGSSRASFYHYFGDMEVFIGELLTMHLKIANDFDRSGMARCKRLFPDVYNLLAESPVPLKFNIQLFRHRDNPSYNYLFVKTYQASANVFVLKLFAEHLGLEHTQKDIYTLWLTLGEAWYSRLDPQDLSAGTLQRHAKEILQSISAFIRSGLYSRIREMQTV